MDTGLLIVYAVAVSGILFMKKLLGKDYISWLIYTVYAVALCVLVTLCG